MKRLLVPSAFVISCVQSTADVPREPAPRVVPAEAPPATASPATSGAGPVRATLPEIGPVDGCTGTAIVLVVDRSGSMSGLPIEMARASVDGVIDTLAAGDCAGVLAFDSVPTRIVTLTLPTQREVMKGEVAGIRAGGGTDILPALVVARRDVAAARRAKRRAVVLLTDGQSPVEGLQAVASAIANDGATLSTIGLGGGTDQRLLEELAGRGNGRAHHVADSNALPGVMKREIDDVKRR
jgi:Ca-activated chloride channel homolog